jgi:hypothetical protein
MSQSSHFAYLRIQLAWTSSTVMLSVKLFLMIRSELMDMTLQNKDLRLELL